MGKLIDLTGRKIGRLKVLCQGEAVKHGKSAKWICQCDCGNVVIKNGYYLTHSKTPSCGCWKKEISSSIGKRSVKRNEYEIIDDTVKMYTNNTHVAFYIDLEDLDKVKKYTWMENHKGYIVRTANYLALHRYLMDEVDATLVIDHKDRDKKNNRKNNLRVVTQQENTVNRSTNKNNKFGVAGVHRNNSKSTPYAASIGAGGRLFTGYYVTLDEAIIARLRKEKELFGEEAPQKHLFKEYGIE